MKVMRNTKLKNLLQYTPRRQELKARKTCHKQPPEVFCKKGVLRNFTKFTGKTGQVFSWNTDPVAKKKNLKSHNFCFRCLKKDHTCGNCKREKICFYCKGKHNSDIYTERTKNNPNKNTDNETSINFTNRWFVSRRWHMQKKTKKDQSSQRSYVNKRVKNLLNLKETS